jgi:hypothetical protein
MIPNLGWSKTYYESKLPALRRALVADKLKYVSHLDKDKREQHETALNKRYEREYLYFDSQHLELLQNELNAETAEMHFNTLQVSEDNSPVYSDLFTFLSKIDDLQ